MPITTITVKSPKTDRSMTVNYDFGANLEEAVDKFGGDVVHHKFVSQCSTDLGNSVRRILNEKNEDGTPKKSEADVEAYVESYKPGIVVKGVGKKKEPSVDQLIAEHSNPDTTEERKAEIVEQLKAIAEAAKKKAQEATSALKGVA